MTADEKIKEVMELVDIFSVKVEVSVSSGDSGVKCLQDEVKARSAIEAKLRELIKDDAQ